MLFFILLTMLDLLSTRFLIVWLFLWDSGCLLSQSNVVSSPVPKYKTFSTEEGLPSSETYFVHQDKNGYIWFCTDHGVVRYDGFRFKVFTQKDGLTDEVVFKIVEDRRGRLWFLSNKPQLSYYENGKVYAFKNNNELLKKTRGYNFALKDLYVDVKGVMHYNISYLITLKIDPTGKVSEEFPFDRNNTEIREYEPSKVFVSSVGELRNMYSKRSFSDIRIATHRGTAFDVKGLVISMVRATCLRGVIFFKTDNNLYVFWNGKFSFIGYNDKVISLNSVGNQLFVGYYNGGVKVFDVQTSKKGVRLMLRKHLLMDFSVTSVMKDSEGGVWVSTLEDGIKYYPFFHVNHYTTAENLPNNNVTAVVGHQNRVYLGLNYRSVQQLYDSYWYVRSLKNIDITLGIFGDQTLVEGFFTSHLIPKDILVVPKKALLNKNRIFSFQNHYIANSKDIMLFDRKGKSEILFHGEHLPNYRVRCLVFNEKKEVFFGNEMGLFTIKDNLLKQEGFDGELLETRVQDLYYSLTYGLLIATRGKGLLIAKNGKIIARFNEQNGLVSNQLNFCNIDSKGRIWLGSNEGLNCLEFRNGKVNITRITKKDGLISNEINGAYEYRDTLWIATKKGLTVIALKDLTWGLSSRILLVKEISSETQKTKKKGFQFNSGTHFLRIQLSTDHFRESGDFQFKYRLNKTDEWIYSKQSEIVLNNPKYGLYALEVSFLLPNGYWSSPKVLTTFSIDYPVYLNWFSIAGYVIISGLLIWLITSRRIRRIKSRHYFENKIVELEQKALSAQMSPHFIFNSLNSIQSFLMYKENEKAEKYLLKFSKLIRGNLTNSREQLVSIHEEVELLMNYVELESMRFKSNFSFKFEVALSPFEQQLYIAPMLLQPYVENAIIHGLLRRESDGLLLVELELEDEELVVYIKDNGMGMGDTSQLNTEKHRSYGMQITRERMQLYERKFQKRFTVDVCNLSDDPRYPGTVLKIKMPTFTTYES